MFKDYLAKTHEVGFISEVRHNFVLVRGLPQVSVNEEVIFDTEDRGVVFSLSNSTVEVILLSHSDLHVGSRVTRTDKKVSVEVGDALLGTQINAAGTPVVPFKKSLTEERPIDITPPAISNRVAVHDEFETGVALVDAMVPLGKGQRELIIGDRKTGKTSFLFQTMLHQARKGVICIYTVIGKKTSEVAALTNFIQTKGIANNCIVVSSFASDSPGLVYLTPYTAMTIAEYFRDNGRDVLVIMDDLSTHANVYREISLVARRFPGRSAYPGDIFFIHSRLLERAGNFTIAEGKTASITCLPVAQSVLGDITGFITTNLMSMTDGHIFFDTEYFDKGRRPAVNPFTSVTRVGLQTQGTVAKELTRRLSAFLVEYERVQDYLHFGSEVGQNAKDILALGDQFIAYFDQNLSTTISHTLNSYLLMLIWSGKWRGSPASQAKSDIAGIISAYQTDRALQQSIDNLVVESKSLEAALDILKAQLLKTPAHG